MSMVMQEIRNAATAPKNPGRMRIFEPGIGEYRPSPGSYVRDLRIGQMVAGLFTGGVRGAQRIDNWAVRVSEDVIVHGILGDIPRAYVMPEPGVWARELERIEELDDGKIEELLIQWRADYIDDPASPKYDREMARQFLMNAYLITPGDVRKAGWLLDTFHGQAFKIEGMQVHRGPDWTDITLWHNDDCYNFYAYRDPDGTEVAVVAIEVEGKDRYVLNRTERARAHLLLDEVFTAAREVLGDIIDSDSRP